MSPSTKLDKDEKGSAVDQKKYRGIIGSLLYLTASRPDIMFSVCLCARFQSNPKESHLKATKRILRYLSHTNKLGLWYPSSKLLDLIQLLVSHSNQFTRMLVCRSRNLPSIYYRIRCKHNFQCYFHCCKEMLLPQQQGTRLLGKTEISAPLLIKSQLVRQFLQILDVKF